MSWIFYPPPPPFVGGRQPYAGQDAIPVSGPTPRPSPHPAILSTIIQAWAPLPVPLQRAPQVVQSGASPQPSPHPAILRSLIKSWDDDVWTVIHVASIGSQGAPQGVVPNQPALLRVLLQAWDLPPPLPVQNAPIAHLIPAPSQPPPSTTALMSEIIALSQPSPYAIPRAGTVASTLPASSQPPPVQNANLRLLLQAWDTAPPAFVYPPGLGSLIVPPSPPPPSTAAGMMALIDTWRPPVWWPLPSLVQRAISGPFVIPVGKRKVYFPAQPSTRPPPDMNTVINPDAEYYVGPEPEIGPAPRYPLWMYNPVLPAMIVLNSQEEAALLALDIGWTASYLPPYGPPTVPPVPQVSVSATLQSGTIDSFSPTGWVGGFTTRLVLQPVDGTSVLLGLDASGNEDLGVPDGWKVEVLNVSPDFAFTFANNTSAISGNSFFTPGGLTASLGAQTATFIEWVEALDGWMFLN